ncbi:hypothetical protein N9174_00730 [bacterium]|nr:hypothetical protein [bacterium]
MSIADLYNSFPDVHPNIVLKTDILRQGIDISQASINNFRQRDDLLWKGFHLFSYDREATKVYGDKIPWYIRLEDGCPIMVRTNSHSPYLLDLIDGEFVIREKESNDMVARKLWFERKPRWYDMRTKEGIQMPAIAQGNARMIFVTMNKYCELWNHSEQCLFCDINATLKDQKRGGEDVVARIDPDVIAEVVKTAFFVDHQYAWLYISGGSILDTYQGQTELEFFCTRIEAIRDKLQVLIPTTIQIAPYDDEGWKRLHATGVSAIQPNIEVWGKELFKWICPGKDKYVGWDTWIKRTIRAVDFWGRGRVQPNFVLGVEMAKPNGFEKVGDAVKSTAGGWDFLMENGVLPRFNLWTQEPGSAFFDQPEPPMEYFIEVQKAYTELRWKHNYDPPFPSANDRFSYYMNSLHDFEYYHGTGTLSKKNLDERLGVKPGERGGREDQEGYTLKWN